MSEKLRYVLFAFICMVCIFVAQYYSAQNQPKPKAPNIQKIDSKEKTDGIKPESETSLEKPVTAQVKPDEDGVKPDESKSKVVNNYNVPDTAETPEEKVEAKTNLFHFVFNSKGGILEKLVLNEFQQSYKKDSPVYKLIDRVNNDRAGSFAILGFEEIFAKATFKITQTKKDQTTIVSMVATKQGITVEKTIEIFEKEYDFNVKLKVTNHRPSELINSLKFVGVMDMEFNFKDTASILSDQIVTMIDDNGSFISAGDVHFWFWSKTYGARQGLTSLHEEPFVMGPNRKTANGKRDKAKVVWGALKNRYFTMLYKPRKLDWSVHGYDLNPEKGKYENTIPQLIWEPTKTPLASGQSFEETFLVYAGPMKKDIINSARYADNKFVDVIDYGFMFPMFIKVIDWILDIIISVIGPNQYWLGIILLTLLVRLCMFPITKKSSMSQAKLQTITPKMKDLKEKYKNDTKKLNEEMMKLYRTEGVNPFTSCLPMFIQLPIFFGLYSTLNLTFDVRFKSFLWINDLAVDDHLFPLGFSIPIVGEYFNLLPILYSVINYITMANMPVAQDEMQAQQQKIMKYMFPVMMLLFFYRMPSALVLYFIVSGIWSIVEQKKIRAKLELLKGASA